MLFWALQAYDVFPPVPFPLSHDKSCDDLLLIDAQCNFFPLTKASTSNPAVYLCSGYMLGGMFERLPGIKRTPSMCHPRMHAPQLQNTLRWKHLFQSEQQGDDLEG